MKIKTVIVDDEPLARQILRKMLSADAEVEIVRECSDGVEALEAIKNLSPDLLFLDIQMSEMDGFAVLKNLASETMPIVVFVTAYAQYALSAFEACALDYLLKPFDDIRLNRTMERVKMLLLGKEKTNLNQKIRQFLGEIRKQNQSAPKRLLIKANGRFLYLPIKEIIWIEAEENYVKIHTEKNSFLLRESIGNLENQLPLQQFVRIHRSTIVNTEYISELRPMFHGNYQVILSNGVNLTLSRRYREKASKILGEI